MTNTLGIMQEILNNYPWTRLSVRIIGAIKRQLFHMVTHAFDNNNLSQEIFAIDTWGAVICSLGPGRLGLVSIKPGLHIVGRIVSICLRPCPKEHIRAQLSRCRLQKSLVRDCYYQKHTLSCEKTAF